MEAAQRPGRAAAPTLRRRVEIWIDGSLELNLLRGTIIIRDDQPGRRGESLIRPRGTGHVCTGEHHVDINAA
jgi:hypothetical protein